MVDDTVGFSTEEQVLAVERMCEVLRPMGMGVMVLGRVAMAFLYDLGGASKDVDVHPFPLGGRDLVRMSELVERGLGPGARVRWEPDGRSLTVMVPVGDREVPVELVLGGEDWIGESVLEDAVRTGEHRGGLVIPTPEHLFVMKAEAAVDRRDGRVSGKFRQDMVQIAGAARDAGRAWTWMRSIGWCGCALVASAPRSSRSAPR
jgi:hypothetical protein